MWFPFFFLWQNFNMAKCTLYGICCGNGLRHFLQVHTKPVERKSGSTLSWGLWWWKENKTGDLIETWSSKYMFPPPPHRHHLQIISPLLIVQDGLDCIWCPMATDEWSCHPAGSWTSIPFHFWFCFCQLLILLLLLQTRSICWSPE